MSTHGEATILAIKGILSGKVVSAGDQQIASTQWVPRDFEHWWRRLEPRLIARARSISPRREQDLVQDIALLALLRIKEGKLFPTEDDFARWAFKRLHYLALDELEAVKKRRPIEEAPPALSRDVSQELALSLRSWFGNALKGLPDRQQIVVRRMVEGYTTREIAGELRVEEATVRSLRRFARIRLAELLQELSREVKAP